MNKKGIIIGAIVVILIILVVIFNGDSDQINESKNEIKIGATLALSGPLAFIGEAEMRGLEFAVDEINENGGINGRRLTLVIENNEGAVDAAVSNVQKLISADKVDLIFSAFTHVTQGVASIVEQANKPMVYASSLASIAESNKLFFRDYFDAANMGTVLGKYIVKKDNKRIAYLGENNDGCEPYLEEVKRILKEERDINLVIEDRFLPDATDFRTNLTKMKSANVDAIFTCTWRKSDIFMKQLKELDMMDIDTYQTVAPFLPNADTSDMRDLYEKNGTISTWYGFSQGSLNKKQQEFSEKFEERYGVKPNSDSAFAYDDIKLIAKNLEICFSDDGLDKDCFSENLVDSIHDGVSGQLSFDENGVSQRDGILITVENGEWVEIE